MIPPTLISAMYKIAKGNLLNPSKIIKDLYIVNSGFKDYIFKWWAIAPFISEGRE